VAPQGSISTFGLPVFALGGEVIGVLTTIPSGIKEPGSAEGFSFSMFMRLLGGGGGTTGTSFVLPAAVVKGIVEQAKVRAVEVAAQRAKKRKEPAKPPAQPSKPATKPQTKPPA